MKKFFKTIKKFTGYSRRYQDYLNNSIIYAKYGNETNDNEHDITITLNQKYTKRLEKSYESMKEIDVDVKYRLHRILLPYVEKAIIQPEIYERGKFVRLHYHGLLYLKDKITVKKLNKLKYTLMINFGFNTIRPLTTYFSKIQWILYMRKHLGMPLKLDYIRIQKPLKIKDDPYEYTILDYLKK